MPSSSMGIVMKLSQLFTGAALAAALFSTTAAQAQLAAPNAAGFSAGHTHLSVPDVAKHREIWKSLGATEITSGRLQLLAFPGIYLLLTERTPTAPSLETSANHIGFTVKDYALYKQLLTDAGASFFIDNAETGQILADLPDGVRVEMALDPAQTAPIVFHHTHLAAIDGAALQAWYVQVFGAEVGERRGLPSAVIPGGRVDFLPHRGETAPLGTQGTAIDHIGFEVTDMDAFAAKLEGLGIKFDRAPEYIDAIKLKIAFITDPVGTYIEITEGLDDVK